MKLLLAIVEDRFKEELETVLVAAGVGGYSEIPHVTGTGESGPRLGSSAYPRTSAIVLSIVDDALAAAVAERVRTHCRECGERAHLLSLDVEQLL